MIISGFQKDFPSTPSWGWNKAIPKKSLYDIGMGHTANSFMLNFVELVHWAPIIPAFLMAQTILKHNDILTDYFDNDQQRNPFLFTFSNHCIFWWSSRYYDAHVRRMASSSPLTVH